MLVLIIKLSSDLCLYCIFLCLLKESKVKICCLFFLIPFVYLNIKQTVSDTVKRIIQKLVLLLAEVSGDGKEGRRKNGLVDGG